MLRETDEMSFADIEKSIGDLGEKARTGKITIDDLQGGTFTITNGGIYGSMLSTPILKSTSISCARHAQYNSETCSYRWER